MAEEENPNSAQADGEEGTSSEAAGKRRLLVGGGILSIVAAGSIAAMMALPSTDTQAHFAGPFTLALFGEEQFSCNIDVGGRGRFLQMKPEVFYYAYDESYLRNRILDVLYPPAMYDEVFRISSTKDLEEIYGEVGELSFMEELRDGLDSILFPVHFGKTALPWDLDDASNLRPGLSSNKNTFRGRFHEHRLIVDAPAGTMKIDDDGPEASFELGDMDVQVLSSNGEVLFIDTSAMESDFIGDIPVGVKGQIIRILPVGLLVQ